jgi:hypothetical protein
MLEYGALPLKMWKLNGRQGLMAHENEIKVWGMSQLLRAYNGAKVSPFVVIGT